MTLYYTQTNIICIVLLLVVAFVMHNERGTLPARRLAFNRLIYVTIAMCVSDVFAWAMVGKTFEGAKFVLQVSNMIYDAAIALAGYFWLNYVKLRCYGLEKYSRENMRHSAIPIIVMMLIIATNPLTGFLFTIDDSNVYSRGPGIAVHWLISWGYLVWATAIVIKKIRNSESRIEKKQIIPLVWFIVPPAIAAAIQMFFYGVTATQCGITLSIVIIAFASMSEKVSKDSLTNLNNRNAFEAYVDEHTRQRTDLTMLMCDVDKFKTINDTLGHVVGDLVLKKMADVLKSVCAESTDSLFLCRYGGDEFLICGHDLSDSSIEKLKKRIEDKVEVLSREYADTNIKLGMSVGSSRGVCGNYKEAENLIVKADEALYEHKRTK